MSTRTRARNQKELVTLIQQALEEVDSLRAAFNYDENSTRGASIIVEPLKIGLIRLLSTINDGQYHTGRGDLLDFLHLLKDIDHRAVPCWPVLRLILETHQSGYQTDKTD